MAVGVGAKIVQGFFKGWASPRPSVSIESNTGEGIDNRNPLLDVLGGVKIAHDMDAENLRCVILYGAYHPAGEVILQRPLVVSFKHCLTAMVGEMPPESIAEHSAEVSLAGAGLYSRKREVRNSTDFGVTVTYHYTLRLNEESLSPLCPVWDSSIRPSAPFQFWPARFSL